MMPAVGMVVVCVGADGVRRTGTIISVNGTQARVQMALTEADGISDKTLAFGTSTSGSSTWYPLRLTLEVEVDFGASPTRFAVFTITESGCFSTSQVRANQSANAPTGKSADDNEMDALLVAASPGAGQLTLYVRSLDGPVTGKFKLVYKVEN